jgi:hypothetical protein
MMKLRRFCALIAISALAACGGENKDDDDKKAGESGDGVSKLAGDMSGAAGGGPSGAIAKPGAGPARTLFKGRFKGIFSGGKKTSQADLTNIFASAGKPSMTPVTASASAASHDTNATQNLWAFAPADAAFGMVVSDGALTEVDALTRELERIVKMRPGGAEIVSAIVGEMADAGINPFDLAAWAKGAGVDLSKGAGMFSSTGGDVVVVLPVTDPAAFQKAIDDDEGNLGPEHCVMAQPGRYVCGERLDYAKAATQPHDSPLAQRVGQLPPWLRGDIELVAHLASFPGALKELADLNQALETIGLVAAAANMHNGALSVRAWLEGKRGGMVGDAFAAIPQAKLTEQNAGASNWYHLRLPMGLLASQMPPTMPPPIRQGFFDNLTGEVITYSRGDGFLAEHLVFGLKDGSKTAPLVDEACKQVKMMGVVQGLKSKPGACAGKIDLGKTLSQSRELAPFVKGMPAVPVQLAVAGNTLEVKLGWPTGPTGKAADLAGTAIAKELVTGNWQLVWWGLATDPLGVAPAALQQRLAPVLKSLPAETQMQIAFARWLYGHVYEAGVAGALREDGIYLLAEVSTFAGDPPEAYAAHEAALGKLVDHDFAGYRKAVRENAAKYRGSLTGRHAATVKGGAPILGQMGIWGIFGGIGAWTALQTKTAVDMPPPPVKAAPPAKKPM